MGTMNAFHESNRRNWEERAEIHAADRTGFYAINAFLAGADTLYPIEAREIGDVTGLRIAHFQCHIGLDTLCLARRGAIVTGIDFSARAIREARSLAAGTGIEADFVEGAVYDAPALIGPGFDMVFTSWGTITWLDDIDAWAGAIAGVLKPGGRLYFADTHPGIALMEERDGALRPAFDWRSAKERPERFHSPVSYTGDETPITAAQTFEWMRGISDIIDALMRSGLQLEMIHEHELLPYRAFPMMVEAGDRLFALPPGLPRLPLSLSLIARRAA